MSRSASFIDRMGEPAFHLARVLTGRDPITGWPDVVYGVGDFDPADFDCDDFVCYTETIYDIKIMVKSISSRERDFPAGRATENRLRIYTVAEIEHRDRIIYHGNVYEVETDPIQHHLYGDEQYRDAILVEVS